ncbi:MAG TPA: Stp1/IreP family PP2C-type Ser/Thr phosphatase [Candidatus Bathyarchaeia archaeon]|nr:Stp1/IreP family PP2C-type Ser/Thr phosphatase [Candidatus Bathyarchaeia archaeon]
MLISTGGASHVGMVRTNNEDCYRIVPPLNLYVLADGMGGEAHGEVASALAVETVVKHCLQGQENPAAPLLGQPQPGLTSRSQRLLSAIHLANQNIFQSAAEHPEQQGMGAALTAAWIDDMQLSVGHVGDSRVYLLRTGQLQQLTSDHSLVAEQVRRGILTASEAEQSNLQSVLLRALGTQPEVEVDIEQVPLFQGDVLLLCSDGLTRMVTEPEIAGTLQAEPDAQRAADKLVEHANEGGGIDNISVIVVALKPEPKGWFSWLRPGAHKSASGNGSAGGH